MKNFTKGFAPCLFLASSIMATSSSVLINDTACTLRMAKNNTEGMTVFEIPELIAANARATVTAEFPKSGWFSSHSVDVTYNIHCEDDDIPDAGYLLVFNFRDDKTAIGACLMKSTMLKMRPTWTTSRGSECGVLIDSDGSTSVLKIQSVSNN